MVKLAHAFSRFCPFKVLVLGDFMLDIHTTGRVKRISPEAPVPVMEVCSQTSHPGGAGNVVLNMLALGGEVTVMGRIGDEPQGKTLKSLLSLQGVDTTALWEEAGYATPIKNRLIADSQQLLRVDVETITPLSSELEQRAIQHLHTLIPQCQVVAISDYGKGFLSDRLLQAAIEIGKKNGTPVIVDPKGIDFRKYRGATLVKPNLSEAYAAAKLSSTASLDLVARQIFEQTSIERLLITRSEAGMSLFSPQGDRSDFPVHPREVKDVTGAGDTVLAMICLGMASGLDMGSIAQLANVAAGLAIERLGCVQITLSELAMRLLETDTETKIFDEAHTYALHQVLKGKQILLLVLQKGQEMTSRLFEMIRSLSQQTDAELMVYVPDSSPHDSFVLLLSSLQEVDYILVQYESLKSLCAEIHPQEIYLWEGEKVTDPQERLGALLATMRASTVTKF